LDILKLFTEGLNMKNVQTQEQTQEIGQAVGVVTTKNGALAPVQELSFNLPALANPQEAMEIMQDNLSELGGNLRFDKVKIPSGGGLSFEIIDENGEAKPVSELVGVVLDHYPINAYWEHEFTGQNNPPDCSSMDCIVGSIMQDGKIVGTKKCANCPHNQWGSDLKGGKGKACKNMIRVYLVQEGSAFPILLTLPPTSTGNWKDYMKRMAGAMKSVYGIVTRVKLEKDKNEGGIVYSKAVFSKADELKPAERQAIKAYAEQLKSAMRNAAIDSTEYNTEPEDDVPGGQAKGDENQPF
jgi:hypothetical protein